MNRVVIVGTTGSGKSTLARQLAVSCDLQHVELDALFWEADWQQAETELFRERVASALATVDRWVVDGNYSKVRDIVWGQADTLIWLDYPLRVVYPRLLRRTLQRIISRENLWNSGNQERFFHQFFTRDSLFVWAWTSKKKQRRIYPEAFTQNDHLKVHVFRHPRETQRWLNEKGRQYG